MLERLNHLQRILPGEGQVVVGVDHQHPLVRSAGFGSCKPLVIAARAHCRPKRTHAVLRQPGFFQGLLHVARTLPRPRHIAKRRGRMIERIHADALVEGAGEKRIAGTQAGAEHAEMLVALLLKPVKAAANVDDRLPPDVGAYRVV